MSKPHGTKEFWLAGLRSDAEAFRAAVAQAPTLDTPVPPCPEWTLLDLVHHLGKVYQFVTDRAGRGVTTPLEPRPPDAPRPAPEEALAWWDERHRELIRLLDGLDPELPAWNWAPQPKKAVFWHRRMAHETAIHRWDAQVTLARSEPIEAKLAADGVTEVIDTWLPAGRRRGPTDMTGVVSLTAADLGQTWYVRLRGEGLALLDTDTLFDDAHPSERAAASATASDLMLALWGRVPFDALDVAGEIRLLEALKTG